MAIFRSLAALLFAVPLTSAASAEPPRKQLAGPPSEFSMMAIPEPIQGALAADSAVDDIVFSKRAANSYSYTGELFVDSKTAFTLSVFCPYADAKGYSLVTQLTDPSGQKLDLAPLAHAEHVAIGSHEVPTTTYLVQNKGSGAYTLSLELTVSEGHDEALLARLEGRSTVPHGQTVLWNLSDLQMHSSLASYQLLSGNPIGLVARMTDEVVLAGLAPRPLRDVVSSAQLDVVMPDGSELAVPMHDDGSHGDLLANDGIYAGAVTATEAGTYTVRGVFEGTLADGTRFRRTTEHLVSVAEPLLTLSGKASCAWVKGNATAEARDERLQFTVGVQPVNQRAFMGTRKYRAYAEVWGKAQKVPSEDVAVAWISQMVDPSSEAFDLFLDGRWLSASGAVAPYELRNVVLQIASNYVPETSLGRVPVEMSARDSALARTISQRPLFFANATKEWREGRNPLPPSPRMLGRAGEHVSGLVMVHGYCTDTNPWEVKKEDFTDAFYFLNPNANIANDEFALKVNSFANSNGLNSFSLVGHSQGGLVSTHLLNYYFTQLDHAEGDQLVQSLGSPYQGCSAAGNYASLGKIFGIACGANVDLATDGAALWLSGISAHVRNEVFYYTTSYEQGKLFGDWCQLALNAILKWPNDGLAEVEMAQMPGAHNMGNKEKWCHSLDMGYPPHYLDSARNKEINAHAAR